MVTMEMGDTWIQGDGSDPRKSAEFRTVARTVGECLQNGERRIYYIMACQLRQYINALKSISTPLKLDLIFNI